LKQKDNAFTGSLTAEDRTLTASFKKIGKDLFVANFKSQVEFKYMEKVPFKNRNKHIVVLLPAISDYNKRKLTKIAKFLTAHLQEEGEKMNLFLNLLTVEKFLKGKELSNFFAVDKKEIMDFLLEKEVQRQVKVIRIVDSFVTSHENFQEYRDELNALFTDCYTSRVKSIDLKEIEEKLKVPCRSLFFKYLLRQLADNFSFKINREKIMFQKLAMSDSEKDSLAELENILQQNKISIFSIANIVAHSDLLYKEVNNSLWYLVENGDVIALNEKYFILKEELNKIVNKLKKYKRNQGEIIDIKSFRELTHFSRKFIIALFEYFDSCQITRRVENHREILISV
jgi:hypothetical protein